MRKAFVTKSPTESKVDLGMRVLCKEAIDKRESVMPLHLVTQGSADLVELVRLERRAFAAKIRVARAVLGWSQSELAVRAGLTQRAVHKLEQSDTEPRRRTVRMIEAVWREQGLEFEDTGDGGFGVNVRPTPLDRPSALGRRRDHASEIQLDAPAASHGPSRYRG